MGVHFYTAYPAAVKNLNLKVPPVAFVGFVSNLSRTEYIETVWINIDGEMKIDFKVIKLLFYLFTHYDPLLSLIVPPPHNLTFNY